MNQRRSRIEDIAHEGNRVRVALEAGQEPTLEEADRLQEAGNPKAQGADQQFMVVLEGVAAAPGIVIGPATLLDGFDLAPDEDAPPVEDVEQEVARFERSVNRAERELDTIISITRERLGEENSAIFEAQRMMLRDDEVYPSVIKRIRSRRVTADQAINDVLSKYRRRIEASENLYLRERSDDIRDVQKRLVTHLRRGQLLTAAPPNSIVVAHTLTAAEMVLFGRRHLLGCALNLSGATSHVAIMARSLGVPAVVSLHTVTEIVNDRDLVIVDGLSGRIIVRPDEETEQYYRERARDYRDEQQAHRSVVPLASETRDGRKIALYANIELEHELSLLDENGAEGIGLVRTESLLLMAGALTSTEEEQVDLYSRIVKGVAPRVSTFRVVDLGGDKLLPRAHREENPFLGWRGIRVLLDRPNLLKPQLRALLRSGVHGPIRLLLPMITSVDEVKAVHEILEDVKEELRDEGLAFDEDIPLGIMIEVPSAALMADQLAQHCDFFSIGTNDLTQFTLAVDRGNDLVATLYQELHPSVLGLIRTTCQAAERHDVPVSICGELAASPRAAPVLVGLGIDELSASPIYLPAVKRVIRAIETCAARELAEQAVCAPDAEAVHALVNDWFEEHLGHLPLIATEAVDRLSAHPSPRSHPVSTARLSSQTP